MKARRRTVHLQETILYDVLGEVAVTRQQIGQPQGVRLVAAYQRRQPLDVALLAAFDGVVIIRHWHMLILSH